MKRLYRYTIRSFFGPFVMTFCISIFVLLMQFLWKYLDDMVGKGLETSIIAELMGYAALSMVPMALPLAVLLASIMTFGNLGERLELLAIKASGVSLLRIMKPLISLSLIIALFAFYMANEIIPVANAKFAALLYSVKEQRPELIIKEGVFSQELPGFSIKVSDRDPNTGALRELMIYDHRNNKGNQGVTLADSGYMKMSENKLHVVITLFNGVSYTEGANQRNAPKSYPFRRENFTKQVVVIPVRDFSLERLDDKYFRDSYRMLKNNQLVVAADSLSKVYVEREQLLALGLTYNPRLSHQTREHFKPDSIQRDSIPVLQTFHSELQFDTLWSNINNDLKRDIISRTINNIQANQRVVMQYEGDMRGRLKLLNRHIVEWHRKFTLSLACIIFFFIGAPLGAIIRKGGFGMPVVVSILMFISYYVVSLIGEKMAREGIYTVSTAMWISTIIYIPIGVFFTYKAVTDSMLMNSDAYKKLMKRLLIFKKKKQEEDLPHEDTVPEQ